MWDWGLFWGCRRSEALGRLRATRLRVCGRTAAFRDGILADSVRLYLGLGGPAPIYVVNFRRMFGDPRMDAVLGSVDGSVRFFGLTPTSMNLEGLDRHHRLMDSYKKLHKARAAAAAASR